MFSIGPPAAHENNSVIVALYTHRERGARTVKPEIIRFNVYTCRILAAGVIGFEIMELPGDVLQRKPRMEHLGRGDRQG